MKSKSLFGFLMVDRNRHVRPCVISRVIYLLIAVEDTTLGVLKAESMRINISWDYEAV
jgi:hypothetical protein